MADYKVTYTMLDDTPLYAEFKNYTGSLEELINSLTKTNYTTHISSDRKNTVIINNRNVLYMEVTEL